MEERENIMSKIRKTLALYNDGVDNHECQSALLMAQRLMAKHDIVMSEIDDITDEAEKEVVDEAVTGLTKTPYWKKSLAQVISTNFRCYAYTKTGGGKSRIYFLGLKEDIVLAKELFEFAVRVLESTVRKYLRLQRKARGEEYNGTGLRNDYIVGFIDGLREKFSKQVEDLCLAPALIKDRDLVEAYESRGFNRGSRSSIQRSHDAGAYNRGHKEGSSLSKHSKLT